ncbi:hypothetical protein B0O99DRAFT_689336 [Bisporella sp. PMI_857]|nr:hypothetical protein B0O99DRAFT_689336 [Bisporella sp. PMI_857]
MGFLAHFGSLTLNDEEKGPKLVTNVGGTLSAILQQYHLVNSWLFVSADMNGERFSTGNDLLRDWLRVNVVVFQEKKYRSDQGDTHVVELLHGGEIVAPSSE